jgi:hypothetical protein
MISNLDAIPSRTPASMGRTWPFPLPRATVITSPSPDTH